MCRGFGVSVVRFRDRSGAKMYFEERRKHFLPIYYVYVIFLLLLRPRVHSFVSNASVPRKTSTSLMGIKGFRSWFESQFPDAILAMPKKDAQEEFDHVLIDMNQLLHVSLRRSRSEGHALTILMKELDACCAMASPKISLVLAMDGPPSAAKLATQRRRRFSTFVRSEWKQQQLSRVRRKSFSKQDEARRRRRYADETKTLCITPGTAFMEKAQQALLYWAWQRMQNPNNMLSGVSIYISTSDVHGEGEVKLLDWILQKPRQGQSIAIMGGDSDLVLEGLVIPPSTSHNVFVLLPDGNKKYFSVSLWETSRALFKFLPKLQGSDVMRVRTDLVLLLILNGNDYLPKLRGSSGFNKVFHTYLRLLHQWLDDKEMHPHPPFLVDPDLLEFNKLFCVAFFRQLAQLAPSKYLNENFAQQSFRLSKVTPLGRLHDLVDAAFVPQPIRWTMVSSDDEDAEVLDIYDEADEQATRNDDEGSVFLQDENDLDEEEDYSGELKDDDDEIGEQVLMRLTLGTRGSSDCCEYEMWHDVGSQVKKTKHRLALMALDDLMGTDYYNEVVDEDNENDDGAYPGITSSGYSWEVQYAVPGMVDKYLGGLLWNLQTYQDGVCADYAFNYGRRMSPTASEIVDFFKDAMKENRTVGRDDLMAYNFTSAVSAGISCLAALPSQVRDLIPEPYIRLCSRAVEEIYASCMDPEDNCFDMKSFELLCEQELQKIAFEQGDEALAESRMEVEHYGRNGRRILTGDHYWTVIAKQRSPLAHPFDPPPPFSPRLSELRPNRHLKASRLMATSGPRPRSVWSTRNEADATLSGHRNSSLARYEPHEVTHSDLGDLLKSKQDGGIISILDVEYKRAYREFERRKKNRTRAKHLQFDLTSTACLQIEANGESPKKERKTRRNFDVVARMREFQVASPLRKALTNVQGYTALLLLNQLRDAKLIGEIDWNYTTPSTSSYASVDPHGHEHVQLLVRKGIGKKAVLFEDLAYEQDRDTNTVSRQSLKQHLCSFVLCDILGPQKRWPEMSFREIKEYLHKKNAKL